MFWNGNTDIAVENNIFYQPIGAALTQWTATISGSSINNNIVYGVSTMMNGSTSGFSVGTNQMGVNPSFVNATSTPPNFALQAGSPAIRAGVAVPAALTTSMERREPILPTSELTNTPQPPPDRSSAEFLRPA